MDAANGLSEPASSNVNTSSSALLSPPPSSLEPSGTSSQQQTPRGAAAAASPSSFARSAAASSPPPPLSPTDASKRTSFDVGNRGGAGAAGAAALRPQPSSLGAQQHSLSRFSLSRVSFSRRGVFWGGTASPDDNTLPMRLGQLLSVRKEEWIGDASLRQRSEEAHGKVRVFFSLFRRRPPPPKKKESQLTKKLLFQSNKSRWRTLALAYASIGVIFGDITTSPIYTLEVTFHTWKQPPPKEEVLGAVSIIVWALTLVLLVKYTLIAEGQGVFLGVLLRDGVRDLFFFLFFQAF